MSKKYTVKQLAEIAGVTTRTLHHYDQIGLLKPAEIAENGYRYYDEQNLLRLQQILFFRELGFELDKIKTVLEQAGFDLISALQTHRVRLQAKQLHLERLVRTVDATILHLTGEVKMSEKKIFEGFSEEKQKEYEKQAIENWGDGAKESIKLWNTYSKEEQQRILSESGQIFQDIAAQMQLGPASPEVQAGLARWHQHLRYFYEPTFDMLRGLGTTYNEHADFRATFAAINPGLPALLQEAMNHYVDKLETEWLERELGILKE
jgi:DNA-binding transcriptional MerR regulator